MWWNKNKWKVIVPVLAAAILAGAFWYGGGAPGMQGWSANRPQPSASAPPSPPETPSAGTPAPEQTPVPSDSPSPAETAEPGIVPEPTPAPAASAEPSPSGAETGAEPSPSDPGGSTAAPGVEDSPSPGDPDTAEAPSEAGGMVIDPSTGKDQYLTDPVPEGKPLPVEPQDAEITDRAYTCTLSISCASILDNMDWLDPEKAELVPEDGWILRPTTVTFYEGESVFNVLQRTCKQQRIHMEFENAPMYNSAYIEGIHNLYEFDCGERSGWMYKVNDWFPNYGCSRYQLKDGDVVCWVYTCDLGADVGGAYSAGG